MEKEVRKRRMVYGVWLGLLILGFLLIYINAWQYNKQERELCLPAQGVEADWENKDIKITIAPRGGSADTWIKRVYEQDDRKRTKQVQYAGIIYDVVLTNQSSQAKVSDWKLEVKIPDACFLNNAWCGELEIHQMAGDKENIQTIDLRKYIEKGTEIIMEHSVEGTDLMIPVSKGDYFVYIPSIQDGEGVIERAKPDKNEYYSKRVDFIAYHETTGEDMTPMQFSEAKLTYHLKKDILKQPLFQVLLQLLFVWMICVVISVTVNFKMRKVMVHRKRDAEIIEQSMSAFMGFIDAKDSSTNGHSRRVAYYAEKIARKMGFSAEECERVYYIGLMHDCGKIGIPESILKKPDKLSAEEYETMKTHTILGEKILSDFTSIEGIKDGVRYHHERFDGKGYPDGLKGEEIPLIARIICVADSFDAMNSVRCYPNRLSHEEIIEQLVCNKDKQFDGRIVDCFLEMLRDGTIKF